VTCKGQQFSSIKTFGQKRRILRANHQRDTQSEYFTRGRHGTAGIIRRPFLFKKLSLPQER
jgi:hypothetical protein